MNNTNTHHCRSNRTTHKGYGPTSFWLQDPTVVFNHLPLHKGMTFVDAGCGAGEYSLHAAQLVGTTGHVIALDTIELSIDRLRSLPREEDSGPITARVCDITDTLPLQTHSADIIMLSTVLHIKKVRDRAKMMFDEFKRTLRPNGLLAVLECKKEEANFGPPLHSRLSADDVEALAAPSGFIKHSELVLEHSYLACFQPR